MSYQLDFTKANQALQALLDQYDVYAPKRFPGRGRYSDTDIVRYDKIGAVEEIVFDVKSDFPAKEVLSPITQTLFYFTEDEYRESKDNNRPILIFMRPCDIHAQHRQEQIYLQNGGFADYYYQRRHDRVKIALLECRLEDDTCFCVSMGANEAQDYSLAVACKDGKLRVEVKDPDFEEYFKKAEACQFTPTFPQSNQTKVEIPDLTDKELVAKLKSHPFWQEQYGKRCISCGSCTVACSTCTCFTTTDIYYNENASAGERKRTSASCQIEGFADMAGGHSFRPLPGDRLRYKALHKFRDHQMRFGQGHMCVGCGRCISRCPVCISITAMVDSMNQAVAELKTAKEGN